MAMPGDKITDGAAEWKVGRVTNTFHTMELPVEDGGDLNDYQTSGIYTMPDDRKIANNPFSDDSYAYLIVFRNLKTSQGLIQMVVARRDPVVTFIRSKIGNSWTKWQRFATTDELANRLAVSGGTMSEGNVIFNKVDNNGCIQVFSGPSYWDGAHIALNGCNGDINAMDKGTFTLAAVNGTGENGVKRFIGYSDGRLMWDNLNLGGSAVVASSFGPASSYIKYANGLLIQWGTYRNVVDGYMHAGEYGITLPVAYGNCWYAHIITATDSMNRIASPTVANDSFTIHLLDDVFHVSWMTVGFQGTL